MSRKSTVTLAAAACLALAACNSQPTAVATEGMAPRFTGYTYGSGNKADTLATTSATGEGMTVENSSEGERTGYTYGSGN